MSRRRELGILALLLLLGGLLRAAYLLEIARDPDFDSPHFESQYHDYWARALLGGNWTPPPGITDPEIPTTPYFRPPGYPYFLAAAYGLFGESYWMPRLVQALLGLGSCLLLWALGRRAFGPGAGLAAAALAAVYWVFLFFEGELMAPALLVFLLLASLLAAARWQEGFTPARALVAGLLVGATALVRPNALVLGPVFLLWALWLCRRRPPVQPLLRPLLHAWALPALVFGTATALAIAPATLRNWLVAGDTVLITSNAGVNLFIGSHPESDGINPGIPAMAELTRTSGWESFDYPLVVAGVERELGRSMRHSEVSAYFTHRVLAEMRADPSYLPRLTLRKLALLWGPAEVSNNKVLEAERESSRVLRASPGFADIFALALLGGALLLSSAPAARGRELSALFLALLLAYTASYLPFFAAARFRLPLVPILMLFAGLALARIGALLAGGRYRPLALALLALALLRAGTGIAWVPYEPDRALWHFRRALSHQEKGGHGEAIAEVRRTLELRPGYPQADQLLADLLSAEGRLEEAAEAYRRALERNPASFAARNNLATALMRLGRPAEAIREWEEAVAREPERPVALGNLALALATRQEPGLGDPARAVTLAEKANRLTGYSHPGLLQTLEIAYRAAGREEDARRIRQRDADP